MTPRLNYDVAVIGLGVYGAALTDACARAGLRTIGFDAHARLHNLGSSHGGSRLFRFTTLENVSYLPLVLQAAECWRHLEHASGEQLRRDSGMAIVEDAGGQSQRHHGAVGVVDSALHMAQQFDLEHEVLTSPAFQARYPRLQAGPQARIYIEPGAFTLHAERCHEALLDRGMAAGAELRYEQAVTALRDKASHVRLLLASGEEVAARRAIVCAGPWTSNLVPADTLSVLPQPVAWFRDDEPTEAFIPFVRVRADAPLIFGFPGFEEGSDVKIVLENERTAVTSPGAAARLLMHELQRDLVKAAHEVLGSLGESATHRQTCYYTSTPDGQLRVGDVTRSIGMVSACSGHGFKYAPAIAQRIASRLVAKQSLDRVLTEC